LGNKIVLDDKLFWNSQIKRIVACRGLFGLLEPKADNAAIDLYNGCWVYDDLDCAKASMSSNHRSNENRSYYSV
jgi:hypothetical protein